MEEDMAEEVDKADNLASISGFLTSFYHINHIIQLIQLNREIPSQRNHQRRSLSSLPRTSLELQWKRREVGQSWCWIDCYYYCLILSLPLPFGVAKRGDGHPSPSSSPQH